MQVEGFLAGCRRAVSSLAAAVDEIDRTIPTEMIANAVGRCVFRPQEEAVLLAWFARFLTIRSELWEVIGDVSAPVGGRVEGIFDNEEWRCFVLGYTAACLVVRLDRTLLETVAQASVTQRKLNEGSVAHRIPRKQYTEIFESFTDPTQARQMEKAMRLARNQRRLLHAMSNDPVVGEFVVRLRERERVLEPSRRRYLKLLMSYLVHTFRRRGASARQQTVFATLETGGRLASELRDRWSPCRVDDELRSRIQALLQPGDVLISRHERALTNLFLPGFWPHAALYIGSEDDRRRLEITIDEDRARRWCGDRQVLEALKDGVLFRPLEETLAVDAVAVIRPQLGPSDLAQGIARVIAHEGKLYNFDFDFFRSDRLVCTEVVYRAYDGLGAIEIPLRERSGRPTLSAEDLLDLAFAGAGFEPVAVFGGPSCPDRLVLGEEARAAISAANRQPPAFTADHVESNEARVLRWLGALVAAANLRLGVLGDRHDAVRRGRGRSVAAYVGGRMRGSSPVSSSKQVAPMSPPASRPAMSSIGRDNLAAHIPELITDSIAERFGRRVPVVTRSAAELEAVVAGNPYLGIEPDFTKLHVVFLADHPTEVASAAFDPDRSPPDSFQFRGGEIYLHLPNGAARTKLSNAYFDAKLGTTSTARNWRTVLKLHELMGVLPA